MSDTSTWTKKPAGESAKPPSSMPNLFVYGSALVVGLAISTCLSFFGAGSLSALSAQNKSLLTIAPTAIGGIVSFMCMLAAVAKCRQKWLLSLQTSEQEWAKKATALHVQLTDSRDREEKLAKSEAEVRSQFSGLEYSNKQLKTELDQIRRAESNLSQRRQELESSKTVLELHVQERTRELQKLQRRYELILNSAGEGICGLGADGKATFVNPAVANITGWPIEELIGRTEHDIFGSNGENGHGPAEEKSFGERVFFRKDGTSFPVEYVKTPIKENGKLGGTVLVFKDITERKRVEEAIAQKAAELARSNAELEQFAFVASHDLQEPLRKIQAFGDRLKLKCEGAIAPEALEYLDRMQSASARMRRLIDDLLAFSRVIRNSEPFSHVDLNVIAKEVLGDLEVRMEKTAAKVELGSLPTLEADPVQMRQLFQNLIGNSLKFQPPGATPVIEVHSRSFRTEGGEEMCEIRFEDNGIGFEEKYLDKIFAVFQRLHGRTEYEGTGVGLAVCRRITDRHRGTITAKSQLGQGATFIVVLPMHQPPPKPKNES